MVCFPATLSQQSAPRNALKGYSLKIFALLDGCLIRTGIGK